MNSRTSRIAYFFGGKSPVTRVAFERVASLRPDHSWRFFALLTKAEKAAFRAEPHAPSTVISFLNPYILEPWLLARAPAFNVHPGSPDFPGRDPAHFARYEGCYRAGATLHRMTASVDAGEILDVIERDVDDRVTVRECAELARQASIDLLVRNLDAMLEHRIVPRCERSWRNGAKRSRKDFHALCEIDPGMSEEEIERRVRAFHVPGYENLFVRINGHVFVYRPDDQRTAAAPRTSPSGAVAVERPRERIDSGIEFRPQKRAKSGAA